MRHALLTVLTCFAVLQLFAQAGKEIPASNLQPGQEVNLNINPFFTPKAPLGDNPFGVIAPDFQPQAVSTVALTMGDEGLPIYFEGSTSLKDPVTDERTAETVAIAYVASLQPAGIKNPATEFAIKKVQLDERSGNYHVKLQQQYMGVPVFGAELIAHTQKGIFTSANGRYAPTPAIADVQPQINAATAIEKVAEHIGRDKVQANWTPDQLEMIGGQQFTSQLVIYRVQAQNNEPHLAWQIQAYPNMLDRFQYFVDAKTGEVLHQYNATCNFHNHSVGHENCEANTTEPQAGTSNGDKHAFTFAPPPPPITATGVDLAGVNRSFGAWQHSDGNRYLVDASKPMFNASGSTVPNGTMKGVIVTRDQKNVYDGPLSHITSTSNIFANPNAVSAHANASLCYDYYKNTFNRNSIDGNGGSINVAVNVTDENGAMDNAYWNGTGIFWGNGNTYFTPLAKSLDVAGHEMTHGVVENTAGLIYENESGAMNESMADIFGVMIDRDDWGISEGIILPGQSPTGLDRDLSDPHNGSTPDQGTWQPNNYAERVITTEDHGGVHANSGITNYAFYQFATNPAVGKEKAEQVYYYTLRDRLTASSKFVDLRLAVIAEATEFSTPEVVNAAKAAFDAVGITTGNPTAKATPITPGTGNEYILSVSDDEQNLNLSESNGVLIETIYDGGVLDKPSVTDNGEQIVFVNADHQIMGVEIAYNSPTDIQYNVGIVSQDNTWRNAAISKDGRFLAGLTTLNDNKVIIFDLADPLGPTPREYFLVNPTFTQATPWIDNVEYADVLEFDYSGQYLIYDAFSNLENADGEDISNWDIGLLKYWDNGAFTSVDTPNIRKLITGLPEHVGVADPAFAKNNSNIIAFDYYIDLENGGTEYRTYVANTETNKNGPIVSNSLELGYPCFTTHDDKVLFQDQSLLGGVNLRVQKLKANYIEPTGNPANIILGNKWGTWLNNSTRVLSPASGTSDAAKLNLPMSISPNPTNGIAQISLTVPNFTMAKMQVMNLYGQAVAQKSLNFTAGENKVDLDLQALLPGTYFAKITTGEQQGVVKFMKQ
ncbi:MAG: M4 family metallopeptidase [Saprospiraceae bacterium]|nr:M4 family metallopeptidase [Saprospiraceae bacterium]MCF8250060.1 M4 family metallopeptidase [Saprospiraceae bacterium]MCF8279522.1 M4 family metallopeptidase [Bacteroidales bacterium]MCF8311974.1 M4 family metallopeptidase [Saprospiraceae bacterium]MCF8440336.1 M4 family metallopeptidase [Saprospiraceae bacterium]